MIRETQPQTGPIELRQVRKNRHGNYTFSDEAAVKLCVADADSADAYMDQTQWAARWYEASILEQSPNQGDGMGTGAGAHVPRFTLSNHIATIVPKMMGGIFYETPPFMLRPQKGTTQDIIEAKTCLFAYQLEEMQFEEEVEAGFDQAALLGTAIFMRGWLRESRQVKKYVRPTKPTEIKTPFVTHKIHTSDSDAFKIDYEDESTERPFFKWCDLRHVLVASGTRRGDIRKAKWVIYRDYLTFEDINDLRGQEGYDIPEEEDLKRLFFPPKKEQANPGGNSETMPANLRAWLTHATPRHIDDTADPLQTPIMSLQRWDKDKVIQILQLGSASILIRNEENEFGKVPFYSFNWRNVSDSFYGIGLGKLIGTDQRVEEGTLNAALNIIGYATQPMYVRKAGLNAPTQQIRQKLSGIVDVQDDVDKAFKIMEMPKVPAEAWKAIDASKAEAAGTSGANEQVIQAGTSGQGRGTGMRSGTGAAAVVAAAASRLDGPVGRFVRQVFEPFLIDMDEMNNDKLPASILRDVLGDQKSEEFAKKIDHMEFRSARIKYEVLAGAKLGPKKEMTQFLPFMEQMMNNPPFIESLSEAGFRFDAKAIFDGFAAMAGWKYSQPFVVPMTPEQKQKRDANSPAAIQAQKAKAQQQLETQKFEQDQEKDEQKQQGKAANEVTRQALEQAMTSEAVTGEPGDKGFGGEPQ